MLMESASHMAHHDNLRGHLHLPVLRITMNMSTVHASIMTTSMRLAAGYWLNDITTSMTLSGMVRGLRGRMSAVTEEDHGSVSSCLSQLKMTLP